MMIKFKNGEPVFHTHDCPEERKGQVMTSEELHDFAVECLMEEYRDTGAYVKRLHRDGDNQPDFFFDSIGREVSVAVMCGGEDFPDPSTFDGKAMAAEYEGSGRIPRLTLARFFCHAPECKDSGTAVCGGEFCFMFYSVSLLPDEKNPVLDKRLTAVGLALKYKEAWEKRDASVIEPYLDRNFHYGSAWVYDEFPSRKEYIDYFTAKLRTIVNTGSNLEITLVRNSAKHASGLLIRQGENVSLMKIEAEDGRITSARMQEPEEGYVPFDPDDELYQCHGDHLDAIMDSETFLNERLNEVTGQSTLFKTARGPVSEGSLQGRADILALRYGEGDMTMLTQVSVDAKAGRSIFLSVYPMMKGADVEVTIDKVRVWDNLTEATIDCSLDDDFSFSFFAVDYYANRRQYKVGSKLTVNLAALGCRAEMSPEGFSFEGQKAVDWLAKIGREPDLDENGNVMPIHFSLEQLVSYISSDSKCPDEAEFQSPVGEPQSCRLLDVDFWKTDIHMYRSLNDETVVDVPLYFRKDMLPELKKDDPVRGWLWMTGCVSGMNEAEVYDEIRPDERADRFECFMKGIDYGRGFDNLMQVMSQVPDLKIREGYEFDAFKVGDGYGNHFQTYCCREKSVLQYVPSTNPKTFWNKWTHKEEQQPRHHKKYSDEYYIQDLIPYEDSLEVPQAIGYFTVPFTEDGIMEAWLLHISAEFMPRFWHALYGTKEFIFTEDKLDELFGEMTEEDANDPEHLHQYRMEVSQQVRAVDAPALLPRISIEGERATISYSYWNDWKGLVKAEVIVRKDGEGVAFGEPEETVLVEYKIDLRPRMGVNQKEGEFPAPHLMTLESPKQILSEDYPEKQWPIHGGWGYDETTPVVIDLDNEADGVAFEKVFIEYRAYEELIVFRPKGEGFAAIHVEKGNQFLLEINGRHYDQVEYTVSACPEKDFEELRADWMAHDGFKGDPDGLKRHLEEVASKRISYRTIGFFDISGFFGKV